jgi:hypothetical protein
MIHLRVQLDGPKHVRLTGLDPVLLDSLFALPEILAARDKPEVHARLFPAPSDGEAALNQDWQEHVTPELRHLFVTAAETVLRDLTGLDLPDAQHRRQLRFPVEHLPAWVSAINQARLILGALHHITEPDMQGTDFELADARGLAIFRIHVLGHLLQMLVELDATGS